MRTVESLLLNCHQLVKNYLAAKQNASSIRKLKKYHAYRKKTAYSRYLSPYFVIEVYSRRAQVHYAFELPIKGQIQRLKTVSTVAIVTTGYNSFNPYLDSLYLTSSWILAGKFLPFRDERFSGGSTPEPLDLCKPGRGPLLLEDLCPKESATTKRVPLIKIRNEQ